MGRLVQFGRESLSRLGLNRLLTYNHYPSYFLSPHACAVHVLQNMHT